MEEDKDATEAADRPLSTDEALEKEYDDDEVEVWVVDDDEDETPLSSLPESPVTEAQEPSETEDELAEARNQWLRTMADFDNFRKRSEREKAELKRYALVEPMRDLLPVIDNLERAIAAEGSVEDLKKGVEMTLLQMKEILQRRGLERVSSVGEKFDPAVHDAVSRFEDAGVQQPTVSDELQSGYRIHDRLLRPAMVRVAMPAAGGSPAAQEPSSDDGEE